MAWSTAPTFTAGQVVSSGQMNILSDDLNSLGNAWTSYSPTLTNITIGTGTVDARYINPGKLVIFQIRFTFQSGSSFTGRPTFSLPVNTRSALWGLSCTAFDTSAASWFPVVGISSSGTSVAAYCDPATAGAALRDVNATTPMTWAAGDVLTIMGLYEAA